MKCGACQITNDPGRRFCRRCGLRLGTPCPACGFANARSDDYCGGCGRPAAAGPAGGATAGEAAAPTGVPGPAASEIEEILLGGPPPEGPAPQAGEEQPLTQAEIDAMFRGGGAGPRPPRGKKG